MSDIASPNNRPASLNDAPERFLERNLAALEARFPEAARAIREADASALVYDYPEPDRFRIGHDRSGRVEWLLEDGSEAASLEEVRQHFRTRLGEPSARIYVLTGFGSGRVASALGEDLKDYNAPVLVLEPNAALFQASLRLADRRAVLSSGKFFFAVGDNLLEQAEAILDRFHLCVVPEFCILLREKTLSSESKRQYLSWVEELNRRKEKLADRLNDRINAFLSRLAPVTTDAIRKVWLYERGADSEEHTRVNQYLAKRLSDAMSESGCEVIAPKYRAQTYHPLFGGVPDVIDSNPDLVVILNVVSTDLALFGEKFSRLYRRPKLCWFVDTPYLHHRILKIRGLSETDILASTDEKWFQDVQSAHPDLKNRRVHFLPLAATYDEEGPIDDSWKCPVSYVGQVRDLDAVWAGLKIGRVIRDVLEQLVVSMRLHRGLRPEALGRQAPELAELRRQYDLVSFIRSYYALLVWEANSRQRAETLLPLADLGLKIYGNDGWNRRIEGTPLQPCFAGRTVAHHDLPRLFRNSQINVNMHHLQSSTSLNLRVFDVPASGGFLLTDYMPGLEQMFEIGKEVEVYRTPDELREKVEYYLAHPEACREIALRGRERVLRDHTFANRWQTIRAILRCEGWG